MKETLESDVDTTVQTMMKVHLQISLLAHGKAGETVTAIGVFRQGMDVLRGTATDSAASWHRRTRQWWNRMLPWTVRWLSWSVKTPSWITQVMAIRRRTADGQTEAILHPEVFSMAPMVGRVKGFFGAGDMIEVDILFERRGSWFGTLFGASVVPAIACPHGVAGRLCGECVDDLKATQLR